MTELDVPSTITTDFASASYKPPNHSTAHNDQQNIPSSSFNHNNAAASEYPPPPTPNSAAAAAALPPSSSALQHSSAAAVDTTDTGLAKRPRDIRLIHMFLANLGVTAYQERVPLQLMDFAYRYTSSTLQDALHLTAEGYGNTSHIPASSGRGGAAGGTAAGAGGASHHHHPNHPDMTSISLSSLRLSIASRTHYQFNPNLPKEFYQEVAQERNRVALPMVERQWGLRLPPEQYCLLGEGWGLKEEWEGEDGEEEEKGGVRMEEDLVENTEGEGEGDEEDEDENGRMEDVFGDYLEDQEKEDTGG